MTRISAFARIAAPLALAFALALAPTALADSAGSEQQQGAHVLAQIQHSTLSRQALTSAQYQNLGEYLMGRALGSTQLHQRMNTLMDEMMGPTAADQMHIYLAKRYLGVNSPRGSDGHLWALMGVMMSGYRGSALAGMMAAYLNGQGTAGYQLGTGMMGYGYAYTPAAGGNVGNGWPTGAILAVCALGLLLVGGGIAYVLTRGRERPHATT
jgi:hypothetical protein